MSTSPVPRAVDVWRHVVDLRHRVERLEAARRPRRDGADLAVVRAVATATLGHTFTSNELLAHAGAVDPALASTLAGHLVDSPTQVGNLLARIEGQDIDGIVVERAGRTRGGVVLWRLRRGCRG